jgi:hypothetical protein
MVNALLRLHDRMTEDEIRATLRAGLGAQAKVMRKPARYPTFADCLRSGGCHHDGLTDGLRAAARMQDAAPGNELGPAEEAGDA